MMISNEQHPEEIICVKSPGAEIEVGTPFESKLLERACVLVTPPQSGEMQGKHQAEN